MIKNGGFPFNVYSLLYSACVTTIADYSGPVMGFLEYDSTLKLHLRAIRAFLGVPRNACNVGVLSEVGLLLPQYRTSIAMVRQYHRMISMDDKRLTKQIFLWDKTLNDAGLVSTWSNEVKSLFNDCNLSQIFSSNSSFHLKQTVKSMKESFFAIQKQFLAAKCAQKPKLRTFVLFKDFTAEPAYITKPLTFFQRRMVAKTRLGCLPLRLETGRYSIPRLPEIERKCLVCKPNQADHAIEPVECEIHFLFYCDPYKAERDLWFSKMNLPNDFLNLSIDKRLKLVLNDPSNVKFTAQFILNAYNTRSKILK